MKYTPKSSWTIIQWIIANTSDYYGKTLQGISKQSWVVLKFGKQWKTGCHTSTKSPLCTNSYHCYTIMHVSKDTYLNANRRRLVISQRPSHRSQPWQLNNMLVAFSGLYWPQNVIRWKNWVMLCDVISTSPSKLWKYKLQHCAVLTVICQSCSFVHLGDEILAWRQCLINQCAFFIPVTVNHYDAQKWETKLNSFMTLFHLHIMKFLSRVHKLSADNVK